MVQVKMFRASISNCINLFPPELNRTEPDTRYSHFLTSTKHIIGHIGEEFLQVK